MLRTRVAHACSSSNLKCVYSVCTLFSTNVHSYRCDAGRIEALGLLCARLGEEGTEREKKEEREKKREEQREKKREGRREKEEEREEKREEAERREEREREVSASTH